MTHPARPPHVALADHFADPGASERPLRIRLTSGEEFDCHAPVFDIEELVVVVTTSEGITRKVRPADIQTLSERRPGWPAYASLGLLTVVPGAGLSALLVPLLSPLGALDGAILGAFGGPSHLPQCRGCWPPSARSHTPACSAARVSHAGAPSSQSEGLLAPAVSRPAAYARSAGRRCLVEERLMGEARNRATIDALVAAINARDLGALGRM